tara:strand:+ start:936 stop:1061 length:126 start_codon:yes stop_codon:yes gene_type:complete
MIIIYYDGYFINHSKTEVGSPPLSLKLKVFSELSLIAVMSG